MGLTIGKAIKIIREAKGKSLGGLAREAEVSVPYLSLVESDKRRPSMDVMVKVADALAVPRDVFVVVALAKDSSLSSSSDVVARLLDLLTKMDSYEERIKDAIR